MDVFAASCFMYITQMGSMELFDQLIILLIFVPVPHAGLGNRSEQHRGST